MYGTFGRQTEMLNLKEEQNKSQYLLKILIGGIVE